MFGQIKKLLGHSAVYGLGAMAASLCTLVLAPIYLRRMGLAEYGRVQLLNSFASIMTTVLTLGVASVLPKMFIHDCTNEDDRKKLLSSAIGFAAFSALTMFVICWALSGRLALALCNGTEYRSHVLMAASYGGLMLIQQVSVIYLRIRQWPQKFVAVSITQISLILILNIVLVWYARLGVRGVQISSLCSCIVSLCLAAVLVRPGLSANISLKMVKHVLRLAIPVAPATMVPWVLNVSDRYFIKHSHGLADTGLYSIGYQIGMMGLIVLINAFQWAWGPFYQTHCDEPGADRMCAKIGKYYVLILTFIGLMVSVFAPEIIRVLSRKELWTPDRLHSCALIVPLVSLSYVLNGIQVFTIPVFMRRDCGKRLSVIMGAIALLNIGLNFFIIPIFGIWGAVGTTLLCFGAGSVVCIAASNRIFHIPFEYANYAKLLIVSAGLYLVFGHLSGSIFKILLLKSCTPIIFAGLLAVVKFADPTEVGKIRSIRSRVMRRFGLHACDPA